MNNFITLKELLKILKKNSRILFLGGIFNNHIISKYFLDSVAKLKTEQQTYLDLMQTISYTSNNFRNLKRNIFYKLIKNTKHNSLTN